MCQSSEHIFQFPIFHWNSNGHGQRFAFDWSARIVAMEPEWMIYIVIWWQIFVNSFSILVICCSKITQITLRVHPIPAYIFLYIYWWWKFEARCKYYHSQEISVVIFNLKYVQHLIRYKSSIVLFWYWLSEYAFAIRDTERSNYIDVLNQDMNGWIIGEYLSAQINH